MIKSYRGLLADGGQERIRLSTPQGKIGYRIIKFQVMAPSSSENVESAIKIYKVEQTTINDDVDFSDSTLLAASIISQSNTSQTQAVDRAVIFDTEIFNQDIYITTSGGDYNSPLNFYIELEQVKLSEQEALVSIVKNLRTEQ